MGLIWNMGTIRSKRGGRERRERGKRERNIKA